MSKVKDALKYVTLKCPKCGSYKVSEKSSNMFLELQCEDCEYTCTWTGNLSDEIIGPTHNAWIEHDWNTFSEEELEETEGIKEECILCDSMVEGEVEGDYYHFICSHCNSEWYRQIKEKEDCGCFGGCCDIHLPDEENEDDTEDKVETGDICAPTQEWYKDQIHKLTKELIDQELIIEALLDKIRDERNR